MRHYIFNSVEDVAGRLRAGMWGVGADEPHRDALAAGDLVLVYLAAPSREFVGRAELASAVHVWTPADAGDYPGDSESGVLLTHVEEWDAPVPMSAVLPRIDSPLAKADFETGIVLITAHEYETVLTVAAG